MTKKHLLSAAVFLGMIPLAGAGPQEQSQPDPQFQQVEAATSQLDAAAKAAAQADRLGISRDPRFQQEDRDLLRARLLASQGKYDEAISLCRKWIAVFEVPEGAESDRRLMKPLSEC